MVWTHFWDMHSGGEQKLDWPHIFIEAPEYEATRAFYALFERNPNRVTCTCCGPDYLIGESATLEQATGFQRGCAYEGGNYVERRSGDSWHEYQTLDKFAARPDVKIVRAAEVKMLGDLEDPPEGEYVWRG